MVFKSETAAFSEKSNHNFRTEGFHSAMTTQPRLFRTDTGTYLPLTGRIFTIGSSRDCHLHLENYPVPARAAHLLFTGGSYDLQSLHNDAKLMVNGKTLSGSRKLQHGDNVLIGTFEFVYAERDLDLGKRMEEGSSPLIELIKIAVILISNRNEDVFTDLVTNVARLLLCDASRLVNEESQTGERKTVARYPVSVGLDRFSNRAIDWARDASHTIVLSDLEWQSTGTEARSLEKNLVGSIMCAPLKQGNTMLGYLYLDRIKSGNPFSEQDREFCDALCPLFTEILINYQEIMRQRETIARLQQANMTTTAGMIFESAVMANLIQLASRLARTDSPVLVLGETGTGKELMARFVHEKSLRAENPFKAINCGAIPENLIESELFGHERGAFTGAVQRKTGLFEAAEGGTVFLDEIGELPLQLQVKLLRVLQESEVIRVGGNETIHVNVRIVAATNKKLELEVSDGRFRQDLYFRLNVLTVQLPPLRERGSDILLLAEFFAKKYCAQFGLPQKSISAAARDMLVTYSWPGNIRELENIVQKAILLSESGKIAPEDIVLQRNSLSGSAVTLREARNIAEREAIYNSLSKTRGNISLAAKILQIDRKWLMKKMEELDVSADDFRV